MPKIYFSKNTASITKKSLFDRSLLSLFITNTIAIFATVYGDWQLSSILFIYWIQSVTIGIFSVKRMSAIQHFSAEYLSLNGKPVLSTDFGKKSLITFFILHYGGFHLTYFIILTIFSFIHGIDFLGVLFASFLFVINHYYSYRTNLEEDKRKLRHIVSVLFHPYARIIPMHLTVILAFIINGTTGLIIFMILKTIADLVSHMIEHADWSSSLPKTLNNELYE